MEHRNVPQVERVTSDQAQPAMTWSTAHQRAVTGILDRLDAILERVRRIERQVHSREPESASASPAAAEGNGGLRPHLRDLLNGDGLSLLRDHEFAPLLRAVLEDARRRREVAEPGGT